MHTQGVFVAEVWINQMIVPSYRYNPWEWREAIFGL